MDKVSNIEGRAYPFGAKNVDTDVIMPKMNGPELIRQLVGKRDDFKVLFMSGFTDVPLEKSANNSYEYSLMKKPFTRRDLLWKVRNVLDDLDRPSRG